MDDHLDISERAELAPAAADSLDDAVRAMTDDDLLRHIEEIRGNAKRGGGPLSLAEAVALAALMKEVGRRG